VPARRDDTVSGRDWRGRRDGDHVLAYSPGVVIGGGAVRAGRHGR
jgi:hypothetical protein